MTTDLRERLDRIEAAIAALATGATTYYSDRALAHRFSVSRCTIWRWVDTSGFPAPVKIGGATRWRASDVLAWESAARGVSSDKTKSDYTGL